MAMDPNFALRTHQRLFTGPRKVNDPAQQQSAWSAVPKCVQCDQPVFFQGSRARHYDGALNMDLKPMEKSEHSNKAKQTDSDHEPITTDRPDDHAAGLTEAWKPETAQSRLLSTQFLNSDGILMPAVDRNN